MKIPILKFFTFTSPPFQEVIMPLPQPQEKTKKIKKIKNLSFQIRYMGVEGLRKNEERTFLFDNLSVE